LEVVLLVVLIYRRVSVPRDWIFFEQDRFEPRAIDDNLQLHSQTAVSG
jgi:hypothetical protein